MIATSVPPIPKPQAFQSCYSSWRGRPKPARFHSCATSMRMNLLAYVCLFTVTLFAVHGTLSAPSTRHDALGRMVHRLRRDLRKSGDVKPTSNGHNSTSSMSSATLGAQSAPATSLPARSGSDHQGDSSAASGASRGLSAHEETSSPQRNNGETSSLSSSGNEASSPARSTTPHTLSLIHI